MSEHSKLSPSARHRWGVCPASVREEAKYPERPSGAAAIDGTHTHTLLSYCLDNGYTPANLIGETLTDNDGEFAIDSERAERVQFALDYINSQSNAGQTVLSEKRVFPMGIDDLSGTVDVQIIGNNTIEIIDYKDGVQPVEVKNNPQLEQYLLGALNIPNNYTNFRVTIIQPKLRAFGQSGISSHELTNGEVNVIQVALLGERVAANAPDAPHVPGESQCKYCAHKGACTALVTKSLSDSGVSFADITKSSDKDVSTMTDKQIVEIIENAPLLRQMLDGVEAEAQRRLEDGASIEGLKLIRGRGSRQWRLDDEETAKVLKKFGLPKDAIYQTKLITVAQAEKVSWSKKDGEQVNLSKIQLDRMKEYVKQTDGKLQVALESDSRAAVSTNVSALFSAAVPSWLS